MIQRSSSTPIRPVSFIEEPHYQQPWAPGPMSSPMILPFELGSTIEDPVHRSSYQLIQPLGNGSYAVVYKVRNKRDNKYYALKCLSKANLSEYHLSIQHNEVILHERLSGHPNLVKLHHTFETSEWLFLVLEYCNGQDLYFWLTQNNDATNFKTGARLTELERLELVKQVFLQILEAVGHCHDNGIAHRDLKPENFIVTFNESNDVEVKLTDFGLATDEIESSDFDCGSKPYMSYECRNPVRETYHPRLADIWSLGIVFLNLVYHRSPWSDPHPGHCKSFATFQLDKTDFLVRQFGSMPEKVAHFLATRVFCRPEEGRVNIREWKVWCKSLVQKMLEEEGHDDDSVNDEAGTDSQKNDHTRKPSWSDVFEDSDDAEMDFTAPVIFTDDEDSHLERGETRVEVIKSKTKEVLSQESRTEETKDSEQQNVDASAHNSDADSGFGTDEDGNGNAFRRVQEKENYINDFTHVSDSITPSKATYCKPRQWGEYKDRGHQRESSLVDNSSPPNNHWDSYNQRRERLEQRRKEKEERKLDVLAQNRRRGLSVGAQDAFSGNSFPRRRPIRQPQNRVFYLNINVTPPTNSQKRNSPPHSPPKSKYLSGNILPQKPSVPLAPVSPVKFNNNRPAQRKISYENLPPEQNAPKKVTKSTKTSLTKMLEKMVVFNRGVRVGGHGVDI